MARAILFLALVCFALTVNAYTEITIADDKKAAVKSKFLSDARLKAVKELYGDKEDKDRFWAAGWNGKVKVSEDHSMMLFEETKFVFMTQATMVAANKALHATGSIVKLYALQGVPTVNALKAADSSEVDPAVVMYQVAYLDNHSTELLKKPLRETIQDCNGMAMQVMGATDGNPTVFVDGHYRKCSRPIAAAHALMADAMKNAADEKLSVALDRWTANRGQAQNCPRDGDAGVVPKDAAIIWAASKGVAWFARPMTGEGFYIHRASDIGAADAGYPHHGAGVIATAPATPGSAVYDALTLEQIVNPNAEAQYSDYWQPHMFYVPATDKKEEFKQKFTQTFQSIEQVYWRKLTHGAITVREIHGTGSDAHVSAFVADSHKLKNECKFHSLKEGMINMASMVEALPGLNYKFKKTSDQSSVIVPTLATHVGQIKVDKADDPNAVPYIEITCGPANHAALAVNGAYSGGSGNNIPAKAAQQTHKITFTKVATTNYYYPTTCFNAYRYTDTMADQEKLKIGDWVAVRAMCDVTGKIRRVPYAGKTAEGDSVVVINYGFAGENSQRACQVVKTDAPRRGAIIPQHGGNLLGGQHNFLQHNQKARKLRARVSSARV